MGEMGRGSVMYKREGSLSRSGEERGHGDWWAGDDVVSVAKPAEHEQEICTDVMKGTNRRSSVV